MPVLDPLPVFGFPSSPSASTSVSICPVSLLKEKTVAGEREGTTKSEERKNKRKFVAFVGHQGENAPAQRKQERNSLKVIKENISMDTSHL